MKYLFVLLLLSYNLLACTCNYVSPKDQYKSADIIFIGRVTEEPFFTNTGFITKLRVSKSIKGDMDETVVIHSGSGGGDCGFRFSKGEDYLVYADKWEDSYHTSICTRTCHISEAFTDLEFIKRLPDSSSSFAGRVFFAENNSINIFHRPPLGHYSFYIQNEYNSYKLTSDNEGWFYIDNITPGTYSFLADSSSSLSLEQDFFKYLDVDTALIIEIEENEVNEIEITLTNPNSVSGIITLESGKPVQSFIDLVSDQYFSTQKDNYIYPQYQMSSNISGEFCFENIPDGKYYLGTNIISEPRPYNPHPRTFYKNTDSINYAEPIEVKNGTVISGIFLKIPEALKTYTISGRLLSSDSTVWEEASIELYKNRKKEYRERIEFDNAWKGKFSLEVLEDSGGWLFIEPKNNDAYFKKGLEPQSPEPIFIEPGRNYNDLVITIQLKDIGYIPDQMPVKQMEYNYWWYSSSGDIFIAKAVKPFFDQGRKHYTFEVLKSFKGKLPDTLQLFDAFPEAEVGKEYLVKANLLGYKYFIEYIIPVELASERIKFLDTMPAAGNNDFSIFCGRAFLKKSISGESSPMDRFSFNLECEREKYRITTDAYGEFFTDSIPPGKYKITVDDYQLVGLIMDEEETLILPYRDILDKNLSFAPSNSISGTATDYNGKPAVSALIEMIPELTNLNQKGFTTITDELGRFKFSNIPSGRFILGINIKDRPSTWNPFSQTFYISKDGSPEVIELNKEVFLTGIDLKVEKIFEVRTLTGRLVDTAGFPAEGIVCFKDSAEGGSPLVCSTAEKESGSFRIKVIGEGWLQVTSKLHKTKIAVPVRIEKNRTYENIIITVDDFLFDPPEAWLIRKITDEEFFLPDSSNFEMYDSLSMLFREWCYDEPSYEMLSVSEVLSIFREAKPSDRLPCAPFRLYPDGRLLVSFSYQLDTFVQFEFRWMMNRNNKKLIAFVAPNDDIMYTVEIVFLNKEKLKIKENGHLEILKENNGYHFRVYQGWKNKKRKSTEFVVPFGEERLIHTK